MGKFGLTLCVYFLCVQDSHFEVGPSQIRLRIRVDQPRLPRQLCNLMRCGVGAREGIIIILCVRVNPT